jgi:hypothetical protein
VWQLAVSWERLHLARRWHEKKADDPRGGRNGPSKANGPLKSNGSLKSNGRPLPSESRSNSSSSSSASSSSCSPSEDEEEEVEDRQLQGQRERRGQSPNQLLLVVASLLTLLARHLKAAQDMVSRHSPFQVQSPIYIIVLKSCRKSIYLYVDVPAVSASSSPLLPFPFPPGPSRRRPPPRRGPDRVRPLGPPPIRAAEPPRQGSGGVVRRRGHHTGEGLRPHTVLLCRTVHQRQGYVTRDLSGSFRGLSHAEKEVLTLWFILCGACGVIVEVLTLSSVVPVLVAKCSDAAV